jgi:hypothetical protein
MKAYVSAVHQAGWRGYSTPNSVQWYNIKTGQRLGYDRRAGGRVVGRIVRYAAVVAGVFGAGYFAGYYLTMAKAAAVAATVGIAAGIKVTRMAAEDLQKLGLDNKWLRRAIAGTVGRYVAILALGAGAVGLIVYTRRMVRGPARQARTITRWMYSGIPFRK